MISFSGDAVVAVWWTEDADKINDTTKETEKVTEKKEKEREKEHIRLARLASFCALQIQQTLSHRRYQISSSHSSHSMSHSMSHSSDSPSQSNSNSELDELELNLRVTVSASHLCGVHVGGVNGRWLFTVSIFIYHFVC